MKIIAVEGIDGCGKQTQVARLLTALQNQGRSVFTVSFPRYGSFWGRLIKRYLHGELGQQTPLAAALLFAADRADFRPCLEHNAHYHDVVVIDRYVLSNMAHQAARCATPAAADQLVSTLRDIEYTQNKLPTPDLTIYLDADPDCCAAAMQGRTVLDQHEKNRQYQRDVRAQYQRLVPTQLASVTVSVTPGGVWRSRDEIAAECLAATTLVLPHC